MHAPNLLPRTAIALLTGSAIALPAAASDDLFASQVSAIKIVEPGAAQDEYLPACFGDIRALSHLGSRLFVLDSFGALMALDLITPETLPQFLVLGLDGVATAVHNGQVLVAGSDGTILRIDPQTLAVLETRDAGIAIEDMVVQGDTVWLAGPQGEVMQGDAAGGDFALAGICGGSIHSLFATESSVFLGSASGTVFILDLSTGLIQYAYHAQNDAISMTSDGETLLIGGSDGTIQRFVLGEATLIETIQNDVRVDAILHYKNPAHLELRSEAHSLSQSAGPDVELTLDAGPEHAGALYFVLGSLSSGLEGFSLDGLTVPLEPDGYFAITLKGGLGVLTNGVGFVPENGTITAQFALPSGALNLPYLPIHHAAITLDPGSLKLTGVAPRESFVLVN